MICNEVHNLILNEECHMSYLIFFGSDNKQTKPNKLRGVFDFIDKLFRHPAFVMLLSLYVGSVLLKNWSDAKARQELNTDLTIQFLQDVGNAWNDCLTKLNLEIHEPNRDKSGDLSDFVESREALFKMRMTVHMKARILLHNPQFANDFDEVLYELRDVGNELVKIKGGESPAVSKSFMLSRIESCEKRWNVKPTTRVLPPPYDTCHVWTACVWARCENLLASSLDKTINYER